MTRSALALSGTAEHQQRESWRGLMISGEFMVFSFGRPALLTRRTIYFLLTLEQKLMGRQLSSSSSSVNDHRLQSWPLPSFKKRVGDITALGGGGGGGGEFVPVPDCAELLLPQSINMLIILPLLWEICWEREALDAKVSKALATTASVGRAFHQQWAEHYKGLPPTHRQ